MKNDLISIIVPIYNVEKYLNRCIDSILNQTYEELEIILIDDGSKDNCPKICDDYEMKDKRVRVMHKKNGGLSDARNVGIDMARGKYISFIDSDDFVEKEFIENLYNGLVNNDAEISCCGFDIYFEEKNKYVMQNYIGIETTYSKIEGLKYLNIQGYYGVGAWNKLYDIKLFDKVTFPVEKICEDWRTLYKVFSKAEKVYYNSRPRYHYVQRKGSITKSNNLSYDVIEAIGEEIEYFNRYYKELLPFAYQAYCINCIGIYNKALKNNDRLEMKKIYNLGKEHYKDMSYYGLKLKKKIQILAFYKLYFLYRPIFKILKEHNNI